MRRFLCVILSESKDLERLASRSFAASQDDTIDGRVMSEVRYWATGCFVSRRMAFERVK
jgi:hypothetical protein